MAPSLVEVPAGDSTLKAALRRSDPNRVPNAPPPSSTNDVAEDMIVLDNKIKQLKFEYDQYFIGSRPREPVLTRGEVNKLVTRYSNVGIQNTAMRFKFNTLCSRLFAMRRQWDETLRKIEAGTYERHVFKAKLHERERGRTGDPELAHVRTIEEPRRRAHCTVLVDQPLVLDGHLPAGEIDELGTGFEVSFIERRAARIRVGGHDAETISRRDSTGGL